MTALVHIHWTQTEAQDTVLASLSWALPVALSINELLILTALFHNVKAWPHANSIMVNGAIWADRSAHIAISNDEAWWALWVPLILAHLAVVASLSLPISTPK